MHIRNSLGPVLSQLKLEFSRNEAPRISVSEVTGDFGG
jgi:hypothetical protein